MSTTETITSKITALRQLTEKNSISPESLGSLLQEIVDNISSISSSAGTSGSVITSDVQSQLDKLKAVAEKALTGITVNADKDSFSGVLERTTTAGQTILTGVNLLSAATTSQAGVMSAQQVTDLNSALTRCTKLESSVSSLKEFANKQISCRIVNNRLFISGAYMFKQAGYVPYLFRLTSKQNHYHHKKRTEADKDRKEIRPKRGWNLFGSKYMVKITGEEVEFSALRHDLLFDQPLYYSAKPDILMCESEDKKGNKRVAWGRSHVNLTDYKTGKPRMLRFRFAIGFGKDLPVNMHPITFANLVCPPVEFSVIYSAKAWYFDR